VGAVGSFGGFWNGVRFVGSFGKSCIWLTELGSFRRIRFLTLDDDSDDGRVPGSSGSAGWEISIGAIGKDGRVG
jgi:hypothetical protein